MIVRIRCAISNCYLLVGSRPVLVDTGAPGDLPRILSALRQHGVAPDELGLILLTHAHSDHAGNVAELQRRSGAKIALHAADAPLARSGRNGVLAAQEMLGRLIRPFVDEPFEAFEPDFLFHEGFPLQSYGVEGDVLMTPGHTPGSCSVALSSGEVLLGDLLRGSMLRANRARPHWFCHDPELNTQSLIRIARLGPRICYPGHFGPFPGSQLGRFLTPVGPTDFALAGGGA